MKLNCEPASASGLPAFDSEGDVRASRAWSLCAPPSDPASVSGSQRSRAPRGERLTPPDARDSSAILSEFTSAWEHGHSSLLGSYLERLDPANSRGAVELIYREYCLAEAAGRGPELSEYISRFPRYAETLERLLGLHEACSPSLLGRLVEPCAGDQNLPNAGDEVGPYLLRRELGRGSFARVFLAEQVNLENRLLVVKIATRPTREPWLLARVRHTHIVEIVSHALVEDGSFHLICMPFWGGATLTAVLDARRGQGPGNSGRDLLADLDAVGAPEFPSAQCTRPARELLAGLSYVQAMAWIGARLAEALDYAFSRDVAHGDVKPSNILISADGNPRLLDFNLARDGSDAGSSDLDRDPGGTLAYMAPERLRALTPGETGGAGPRFGSCALEGGSHSNFSGDDDEPDCGAHRADIYALGMVLLEAITGRPPEKVILPDASARKDRARSLESAASIYAAARGRGARVLIDEAESAGGRKIPPGLRAILEHALEPDPDRRFRRARDLAEDLDRWRTNRPLAFATEPFWGHTVPSWLKRRRRLFVTILAVMSLLVGLPTTALIKFVSTRNLEDMARSKLASHWDDAESYQFRRSSSDWLEDPRQSVASFLSNEAGDTEWLERARRALRDYGVFEPGDWRLREEVRYLPRADQEDLELWLLEQAYRYCVALCERPESQEDWKRAQNLIEHLGASTSLAAFTALGDRLKKKLELAASKPVVPGGSGVQSHRVARPPAQSISPWLNEYLLGIATECDLEVQSAAEPARATTQLDPGRTIGPDPSTLPIAGRPQAARALEHYREVLAHRPDSYWAHYRAAGVCYLLGSFSETAEHLERCLALRPNNPALRGYRAACLAWLDRHSEALQECDLALSGAPDLAELYRTRAFIRAASGQKSGLESDLYHFELLSAQLPRGLLSHATAPEMGERRLPQSAIARRASQFPTSLDFQDRLVDRFALSAASMQGVKVQASELTTRYMLASTLRKAGEPDIASGENAKILILDPDHIPARMARALEAIDRRQFDQAQRDLDMLLDHPNLMGYLRRDPTLIRCFHDASRLLSLGGKVQEGRVLARKALDLAITLNQYRPESHYNLARAYALCVHSEPQLVAATADNLWRAFVSNPAYQDYYEQDSAFDPVREQIAVVLRGMRDPAVEHQKIVMERLAQAR